MGLLKGLPDLCIMYPHKILWLEVKTAVGRFSPDQKKIARFLQDDCWGGMHALYRVNSLEIAQEIIREYGSAPPEGSACPGLEIKTT